MIGLSGAHKVRYIPKYLFFVSVKGPDVECYTYGSMCFCAGSSKLISSFRLVDGRGL